MVWISEVKQWNGSRWVSRFEFVGPLGGLAIRARVRAILDNPSAMPWGTVSEVRGTVVRMVRDTVVLKVEGQPRPVALPIAWVSRFEFAPGQLRISARVRVTAPSAGLARYEGILTRLAADTLVVGTTPIAVERVTRLEVSHGKRSNAAMGAAIGMLVGAGFGALAYLDPDESSCSGYCVTTRDLAPFFVGGFAFAGLVVGGVIGVRREQWRPLPLDRLRVGIVPQRDGRFALGASVRF